MDRLYDGPTPAGTGPFVIPTVWLFWVRKDGPWLVALPDVEVWWDPRTGEAAPASEPRRATDTVKTGAYL